jgi:hypothetical protein
MTYAKKWRRGIRSKNAVRGAEEDGKEICVRVDLEG